MNITEIDQQSPAFFRSAAEMSSDGSKPHNEQSPRMISEADSSRNRDDDPVRLKVDRESSVRHVQRLRYVSSFQAAPNSTRHKKSKQSKFIDTNNTTSRLLTTSLFQRRKLRLDNLRERREALLPLDKRTNLDRPTVPKSTQINRPTNKPQTTSRPCCLHSYPLHQTTPTREDRIKRSTHEEDIRQLKNFFIRLLEATMDAEERVARNLTDSLLDALLKNETEFNHTADDRNRNQTGIKKSPDGQKNETLVANNTVGKGNSTGKSVIGGIGGTNETGGKGGSKNVAEVGESVQGAAGNSLSGEIGGAGDGKLIISAQILNGSESKELGQIVVNSKNRMEVAIKMVSIKVSELSDK